MLTIVIPTRNRARTLAATLESIVQGGCADKVMVHVLDNASDDDTHDVVRRSRVPYIEYFRSSTRLSMSENHSRGIDTVKSEWVTILGDDDAVAHGGLAVVLAALQNASSYAVRVLRHDFLWQDATPDGVAELRLSRQVYGLGRRRLRWESADQVLQLVLDGRASYTRLPVIYNGGFVRTAAVKALPRQDGCLFPDPCPDVYSGIALAMRHGRYQTLSRYLLVNGASETSTGHALFGTHDSDRDARLRRQFERESKFSHSLLAPGLSPPTSIQFYVFGGLVTARRIGLGLGPITSLEHQASLIESRDGVRGRSGVVEWVAAARSRQIENLRYASCEQPPRALRNIKLLLHRIIRGLRVLTVRRWTLRGDAVRLNDVADAARAAAPYL